MLLITHPKYILYQCRDKELFVFNHPIDGLVLLYLLERNIYETRELNLDTTDIISLFYIGKYEKSQKIEILTDIERYRGDSYFASLAPVTPKIKLLWMAHAI